MEDESYEFDEDDFISEEPEFEQVHWDTDERDEILDEMGIDFDDD